MRKVILVVMCIAIILVAASLTGCAADPNPNEGQASADEGKPAGFWTGLWQGMILPITFLISLFSDNVTIYEVFNNGGWYNFGFFLGAAGTGGGTASSARRSR